MTWFSKLDHQSMLSTNTGQDSTATDCEPSSAKSASLEYAIVPNKITQTAPQQGSKVHLNTRSTTERMFRCAARIMVKCQSESSSQRFKSAYTRQMATGTAQPNANASVRAARGELPTHQAWEPLLARHGDRSRALWRASGALLAVILVHAN